MSPTILYSAEAEKAVLGCMIAQPGEVNDTVLEMLGREDFFVPAHQEVFAAVRDMENTSQAIDIMTIHQWLEDHKLAASVGSPGILTELGNAFATHLNVWAYIQIVKDKSVLRALQAACSSIVHDIAEMPDSVPSVLDRAEQLITKITQKGASTTDSTPAATVMEKLVERITSYDGRRPVIGVRTGFSRLDEYTGGWKPGQMIVVAARPGIGKTALALAFLHAAVQHKWCEEQSTWVSPGVPAGLFSVEMPHEQIAMRRLAMKSSIPLDLIGRGLVDPVDRGNAHLAEQEMREWPLYVRDPSSLTLTQCRSKARRMRSECGIELLVIDYMQLITSPSKQGRENRQNEVAEISRGIKGLALELGIPIIVLAQLNRKSDEGKLRPGLHNLRESGGIEQDADVVLLLSQDEVEGKEPDKSTPVISVTCDIAKQRNGPVREIPLQFHRKYTRYEEPVRAR